jgi:phosphohistidine phosphatase
MPRLFLLRHAKSSWDDPSIPDHDRPLNKRGRRAAERMGEHLRAEGPGPDLVLCSSSRRTRETLERLGLGAVDVSIEDGLYGASKSQLLERIRTLDEGVGSALVIGHNPGLWDLATALTGADRGHDAARLREKFPTGAVSVFEVDGGWDGLGQGTARLTAFTAPQDLP